MNEELLEILKRRSSPGVAIFNLDGRLLYVNNQALQMIPEPDRIFDRVKDICDDINVEALSRKDIIFHYSDKVFSVRAFPIGSYGNERHTHIMVLLERITERREVDLERAKNKYNLTKREIEIVSLISKGLSNKEISERLSIKENTVKDHIKNIMDKMGVRSRSEIIALLK